MIAAYDAPFPDETYKEGARQFPTLVPTSPDDPAAPANRPRGRCWRRSTSRSCAPSATTTRSPTAASAAFLGKVPGAAGQPHTTIEGGGHFLQEDRGPELAKVVIDFIASTS